MTHAHAKKIKAKGHSVQKIEWKQTAGQTDPTYCITVLTNAVGNELLSVFICIVFNNS